MSGTMKKVNQIVMFVLFLLLLETVGVHIFLAPPVRTMQMLRTAGSVFLLALAIAALYMYEKRGNRNIVIGTFSLFALLFIASGIQNIITTGSFATREGAVIKVQGGAIVVGFLFLVYALVVWFSKPTAER